MSVCSSEVGPVLAVHPTPERAASGWARLGGLMSVLVGCGASLGLGINGPVCISRGEGGQVWDSEWRKALVHNRGPPGHFMDQRDPEIIK